MPVDRMHLDFEGKSGADLKKTGVVPYCEHPSSSPLCFSYSFDSEPHNKMRWRPGEHLPARLLAHIAAGAPVVVHNAAFERNYWNIVFQRLYPGIPKMTIEQQDCTMSRAQHMGYPGGLDVLGRALQLNAQKDKDGYALMMKMSRPRSRKVCMSCDGSGHDTTIDFFFHFPCQDCDGCGETYTWWHDDAMQARLEDYCDDDIGTEAAADWRLPALPEKERAIWELDQKINDRGIRLDEDLVHGLIGIVDITRDRLDRQMRTVTNGKVAKCSQGAKLRQWLGERDMTCEHCGGEGFTETDFFFQMRCHHCDGAGSTNAGFVVDSLAKGVIEDVANMVKFDPAARHAVWLFQEANKSSVSKLPAMLHTLCLDGRSRGLLCYHGASTGRWAGRLWQPQNLPRLLDGDEDIAAAMVAIMKQDVAPEAAIPLIEEALRRIAQDMTEKNRLKAKGKPYKTVKPRSVMYAVSVTIRACVVAERGKVLIGADYSNIEGRTLPWLCGYEEKLEKFRAQDSGEGFGLYELAYAETFGIEPGSVTPDQRQIGKVMELACIAKGQLVLTSAGLLPIEDVKRHHKVWDGVEWVSHEGVVLRGIKNCIEYDGLIATEDHIVWTREYGQLPFGIAAARKAHLVITGHRRTPLRMGGDNLTGEALARPMAGRLRCDTVLRMRQGRMDIPCSIDSRQEQRMSGVFAEAACAEMAGTPLLGCSTAMRKPKRQELPELRGARDTLRVCRSYSNGGMDRGASGSRAGQGNRSDRQQQALRAGQSPMVHAAAEPAEQQNSGKRETFDIRLAGPRNRFTVSGRLVHNCGYQGGVGAFMNMAANYGLKPDSVAKVVLPEATSQDLDRAWRQYAQPGCNHYGLDPIVWVALKIVVNKWRAANAAIAQFWWDLQDAALRAVHEAALWDAMPEAQRAYIPCPEPIEVGRVKYLCADNMLMCQLPDGKVLYYDRPFIRTDVKILIGEDGEEYERVNQQVYYWSNNGKGGWGCFSLYGGLQCNHVTQGTARQILADSMLRIEAAGHDLIATIHDENISEVLIGSVTTAQYAGLMEDVGPVYKGLPIRAVAWSDGRM